MGGEFTITWHGHSCFSVVEKESGFTVVFDPFKPETGILPKPDVQGDLVLATHRHFDHENVEVVAKWNAIKLKEFIGDRSVGPVKLRGVLTYHDEKGGKERGVNAVYVVGFEEGIFVHLGDLGHILSDEQVSKINGFGRIDVLFVPVGGVYTIGPEEAVKVIKQLNPRIAIPMHYYDDRLNRTVFKRLRKLDDFLKVWDGPVKDVGQKSIDIMLETLPEVSTVFVLKV
ncbi:MAG: MBL fold metallo-hydrolase [Candidatus Njordarchaeia archaeon]